MRSLSSQGGFQRESRVEMEAYMGRGLGMGKIEKTKRKGECRNS